uniref:Juxtamembrane domain-associated catenin n=1 Tax=Ascaris suum TaxID=6253 RepID=F1KQH5_ASCSU
MEPIPEEELELAGLTSTRTVKREQKSRLTEVYTSEQVDTLVSTVPESAVPDSWKLANEEVYIDPSMASTYVTEALAGPTSARGSTYSYTYESHYDEPPHESEEEVNPYAVGDSEVERLSTQTQKITRVTKVTTTRSVRQLPIMSSETNFYFDAEGSPMPIGDVSSSIYENVPYSDSELLALGIDLTREKSSGTRGSSYDTPPPAPNNAYESEIYGGTTSAQYDVPGCPGVPQVTHVGSHDVELAWLRPDSDGRAGPLIGYQVEIRRVGTTEWAPAHDFLIKDTSCRITNLDPMAEYEFRVLAANSAGFGLSSAASAIVQLRPRFDDSSSPIGEWRGTAPGRPYVSAMDTDRVTIEWAPAIADPDSAPVAGYQIEYRPAGTVDWIQSNDYLVVACHYEVQNLRPNGEYEFRVRARSADGLSEPSPPSGIVRIKPSVPSRGPTSLQPRIDICPPGQPQVEELDSDWVKLRWAESGEVASDAITYIVEYREIGDPLWYTANTTPIYDTTYTVNRLRTSSTYEFRVIARSADGGCSLPSPVSDVVQLRPSTKSGGVHGVPSKPLPPEYVDFEGGDRVTLCWFPAASSLPIEGYDVEFRDYQQDSAWYKVNELLIHSCKMTVGDLIVGHEYQFRVIARNALGFSEPSDPSPPMLIGAPSNGDMKYVEAERYGTVPLLQDEMVRESPPLPDRDDSPPPIHRTHLMKGKDGLHWRDPTLREVIEYLDSADKVEQLNASGYLQHLTFNDNAIKEETRELKGIPKLVKLLGSDVTDIQKNACGCLKNLSFGKENDNNKRAIRAAGGLTALTALLRQTPDAHVREEATAALWNLSSCDDLKPLILEQCSDAIVQRVVVPCSGIDQAADSESTRSNSNVFRNGTGVLRNVSAASVAARKTLRACPRLVDSLVHYLTRAVLSNQVDARAVENVVCILRNLSYRIQEVEDPNYDPRATSESTDSATRERSRSAPSGSPKTKKKDSKKKKKAISEQNARNNYAASCPTGAELLWQPEVVKLYLRLLQESSNSDTLEASAGAIQNLAACEFEPSVAVRGCVRTEKGLPVLVELLRLNDDKVVCAVTTALRNLALDQRNRELIGKYAMKDLVSKLPRPDQRARDASVGDATIGAVLGILFETVKHSADFTRNVHECGGTERLRYLARSHPMYTARICKYASQVLYVMWQHKELHDGVKRSGLKESDFYSGTTSRARDSTTLARPISSQGAERPANLRSENLDDSGSGSGTGRYGAMGSTCSVSGAVNADYARSTYSERSTSRNLTPQYQPPSSHFPTPYQQVDEPLYASVHKRNGHRGSTGGDSWV